MPILNLVGTLCCLKQTKVHYKMTCNCVCCEKNDTSFYKNAALVSTWAF